MRVLIWDCVKKMRFVVESCQKLSFCCFNHGSVLIFYILFWFSSLYMILLLNCQNVMPFIFFIQFYTTVVGLSPLTVCVKLIFYYFCTKFVITLWAKRMMRWRKGGYLFWVVVNIGLNMVKKSLATGRKNKVVRNDGWRSLSENSSKTG